MEENKFISGVTSADFDKALRGGLDAANGKFAKAEDVQIAPVQSVNGKTGEVQLGAGDVGADAAGTAAAQVSGHNVSDVAHNDIRMLIEGLATRLNALADSDDTTLDQMSEIVAYIKANKTLIDSITTSKVNVTDIINNLTTNVSNKPLSAAQGVILKGLIDALSKGKLDVTAIADWAKAATKPNYTKSEVGLGNVDNVKQYSASNPPPYPVTNVNGKTGAVTIDVPEVVQVTGTNPSAVMSQKAVTDEFAKRGQLAPEFAESVEWLKANGDTSKLYVLPDGFIYAWMYAEITVEPVNAIPTSTDTDRKTIYNGKGYKLGMRINSSGDVTDASAPAAMGVTGFISAKVGNVIELRNYVADPSYTSYVAAYDSSNVYTGKLTLTTAQHANSTVTLDAATFGSNFNAIRVSGDLTDATSIINKSASGTTTDYQWVNTGRAFVPADYEDRIVELEAEVKELNDQLKKASTNQLAISEVFAPSPQLPADGSETADFNGDRDYITAEQIYAYLDALLNKYPRFITKEVMGKDASGTHDWCRYVCSRRAYDAWQEPNYPAMYAWVNGSTVIYSVSVSPRIGDTLYTTPYVGAAKGAVTAVSNANQSRTVGGVAYTRDKSKDVEPALVYTETAYSPYFSSNYASLKNGVYDSSKAKISTISGVSNGTLTDASGAAYIRYPLGDKDSSFKEIPAIVIGGNEHGTGGDPATPAMIAARMAKDLCECKQMDNPLLNLLKNEYMVVFCPVVSPWGFHKDNQSYYNSNGVNLDRNFDTPGWMPQSEEPSNWPTGAYGGSEVETQYFMNTLVVSKAKIAMCNHSYGHGVDSKTGEAVSGGICSYMMGRNKSKYNASLLRIAEVMAANYNLVFTDNGEAPPEIWAKTRSYFEWIGVDGVALEMNSREGFITDPNNEAQGKQFTDRVMEAAYTQLLQVLLMMVDRQG